MKHYGFTGPRKLTNLYTARVLAELAKLGAVHQWHVGDALGLNALIRTINPEATVYRAEGRQPWQLAKRSKAMVDAIAAVGGELHAWPNKSCPDGVKPSSTFNGKGSGTWGTIAYAIGRGVPVVLHPLSSFELPDWLKVEQRSLF